MSIIRNDHVALSNLRKPGVALSVLRNAVSHQRRCKTKKRQFLFGPM